MLSPYSRWVLASVNMPRGATGRLGQKADQAAEGTDRNAAAGEPGPRSLDLRSAEMSPVSSGEKTLTLIRAAFETRGWMRLHTHSGAVR